MSVKGEGEWSLYLEAGVDVRLLAEAPDLVEMVIVHMGVDPEQPLEHLLYRVSEVLGEGSVCGVVHAGEGPVGQHRSTQLLCAHTTHDGCVGHGLCGQEGAQTRLDGEDVFIIDEALNPCEELLHVLGRRQLHGSL